MKRVSAGFTLLEILVATAILSMSLITVMTAQGNTLMLSRRAELLTVATMLAKQRMMDLELELQSGMRKGEFPEEKSADGTFETPYEHYHWNYDIKFVNLPAPVVGDEGSLQGMIGKQLTEEISKSVREIHLVITWTEGGKEESIDLVTHLVKLS